MKSKLNKTASLLLVTVLASSLAACTGSNNSNEGKENTGNAETPVNNESGEFTLPTKYDPPVSISAVRHVASDANVFQKGESIENNVHTKWAMDKMGIDINYLWTTTGPDDAFTTKLNLAFSAGEELPDIIQIKGGDRDKIAPLLSSGQFADAGALFEKYAGPNTKAAYAESPDAWNSYTLDGTRIGLPILDKKYNSNLLLFMRTDWLKNVGLEVPETIAEMEAVMEAFVRNDPDKNGKDDTYGLTVGLKNQFHTWMSDAGFAFFAHGGKPDVWTKNEEGKLVYGSIQPEIKQGLQTLHNWMDKAYIHPESALWDEVKATELWTSGKAGMIIAPRWAPTWPLDDVKKNVEGADYWVYKIPVGPDGKSGTRKTPTEYGAILFNKDMKHPEAFFTYIETLYTEWANPQAGSQFELGFAEGYDYIMENGKPVYDREKIPNGYADPIKYSLNYDGGYIPTLEVSTLDKLNKGEEPVTPYEKKMKDATWPIVFEASSLVMETKDLEVENYFTGLPTQTQLDKGSSLRTIIHENFLKIIYGELPVEEFDKIVEDWKASGGDQITEEVNEWYEKLPKE